MILALTIIHVIISLALIVVVLLQHGKQQGLSGAIAGGAETFFGKNKGRTVDAMLKKFTAVIACLFIISSLVLAGVSVREYNKANAPATDATQTTEGGTDATGEAGQTANVTMDEDGNLVDEDGNVVMTAEQIAEQQAAAEAEGVDAENTDIDTAGDADANAEGNATVVGGAEQTGDMTAAPAEDQPADTASQTPAE